MYSPQPCTIKYIQKFLFPALSSSHLFVCQRAIRLEELTVAYMYMPQVKVTAPVYRQHAISRPTSSACMHCTDCRPDKYLPTAGVQPSISSPIACQPMPIWACYIHSPDWTRSCRLQAMGHCRKDAFHASAQTVTYFYLLSDCMSFGKCRYCRLQGVQGVIYGQFYDKARVLPPYAPFNTQIISNNSRKGMMKFASYFAELQQK